MQDLSIKRLDHLGLVAATVDEIGLVDMINKFLGKEEDEVLSKGQAVKSMILNGLGFTETPLYLTPEFFDEVPVETLVSPKVSHEHINRHKLGRVLDQIHEFGCEKIFLALAQKAHEVEKFDCCAVIGDTTTHSITGRGYEDCDEHEIQITKGYSKDHRPDLRQIVSELVVSHDEGIPLIFQNHSGNESDIVIFKERCKELKNQFFFSQKTTWIVDSKGYTKEACESLKDIYFATRIPENISQAKEFIRQDHKFISQEQWHIAEERVEHYGIDQKWLCAYSDEGLQRASKSVQKRKIKEFEYLESDLFHLQAQRFSCARDAQSALNKVSKKLKYHEIGSTQILVHKKRKGRGRPKIDAAFEASYQIKADIQELAGAVEKEALAKAKFIIGSNRIDLNGFEILKLYKKQGSVERGFRFLKDPHYFVSSLFLKKTARIEALLLVMTLALLVYSITQRKIRKALKEKNETIPDQIRKPSSTPTTRRVYQLFYGVNIVSYRLEDKKYKMINGMNDLRLKIIELLGGRYESIYKSYKYG